MDNDTQSKPSKIPYFFFAFFAVVITVNIGYIYLSKKTWRGIVTSDSYQKGINYNQTLEQVKQQNNLHWQVQIKFENRGKKNGVLIVSAFDKNHSPITDADVSAIFKRPTQEGLDFTQKINLVKGVYRENILFPLPGQWEVQVVVARGKDIFQEAKRYVIQR